MANYSCRCDAETFKLADECDLEGCGERLGKFRAVELAGIFRLQELICRRQYRDLERDVLATRLNIPIIDQVGGIRKPCSALSMRMIS